jgi:hypothetical protein
MVDNHNDTLLVLLVVVVSISRAEARLWRADAADATFGKQVNILTSCMYMPVSAKTPTGTLH